jgi:hypothetical protein
MTLTELIGKLAALHEIYGDLRVGYGEGYDYVDEFNELDRTQVKVRPVGDRAGLMSPMVFSPQEKVVWLH